MMSGTASATIEPPDATPTDERIDPERCYHGHDQEHDLECLRW